MREAKMNVLSKIKSVFNRKSEAEVISADEVGVNVEKANNKTQLLRWEQVNRIAVYKKDEITTDLICIEFGLPENMTITLHEEMEGYDLVVPKMHMQFEGIEKDWYSKIVKPAFKRNYRVIYETSA